MINRNRVRLSKLALGLAIALAAAPAVAQNTTSALDGRVSGASGAPVAGAQVTIVHAQSGSSSTVTTDAEGRYAARGLRPGGPYTITVSKDGVTETRENVYLQLAETAHFDARLGAAGNATDLGAVTVVGTGDSLFSPSAMGAGTAVSRDKIEGLASVKRDLMDYARLDPRVSQTTNAFGQTAIQVAGQNNRFNSITIDGVTTSDTFGLESNGLPTAKQPISIDAIDSVQINVSNYDVTQTAYIGANVNAVTKSGTNEFHGTLTYVFRNDSLSGDRFDPVSGDYSPPPDFKETTKGFTFGGPILKDRLFFFAGYEEFSSSRTGVQFGPLGSGLTEVGISPTEIDQVRSIASRACTAGGPMTCGMDIGTSDVPSGTELSVKEKLLKFDWNINDNHRASLRWNQTSQSEPIFRSFSPTSLSLSSHWDTEVKEFESAVLQVFSDWSQDFSTELKLAYRTYDKGFLLGSNLPDTGVQFQGVDPTTGTVRTRTLRFGAEQSEHFNQLNTDTFDGYLAGTWFKGDHEFKFGGDFSRNEIFNAFQQRTKGSYTFQCLLASQCANSFEAGIPLSYSATVPQAGRTLDDAAAIWGIRNIGLFAQDTWTVNDNLTVTYGVRFDEPRIDQEPLFQETAGGVSTSDAVVLNNATSFSRQTGGFGYDNTVTIDGKELWEPRVGFNYTFDSERRMQLRGGVGLFQGSSANVWLSNPYTNTGEAVQTTGCGGSLPACGVVYNNNGDNPPVLSLSAPQLVVDIIDPELEQPSVWKANLGFERELGLWGMVFSADWIGTRTDTAIWYQNLNIGLPSAVGPDGRPLFWNASGLDSACFKPDGTAQSICTGSAAIRNKIRSNSAYGNVIIARPTDKGRADAFTVALSKEMRKDWGWSLAYTYTDSEEVSGLTSSTSGSQWGKRASVDPNSEFMATSNYEIKDRFNGTLNWRHAFFGDYETRVGLFYEGRSGRPYSWVFIGDMNGDGQSFNDLLYIPSAPGSGEVVFQGGAAEEAAFWDIVNSHDSLKDFAGGTVDRNGARSPWVNQFDLRITQELPGFMEGHKVRLGLDVLNFGNLINKKWGRIYEPVDVDATRTFVRYVGMQGDAYVYSLVGAQPQQLDYRDGRGESSWAAQLTLNYEF
jgi:hypothetical protein